ncbi:MAG TPA: hypothetical protein VEO02_02470 [Thermoanaerobaculia bacterium]|nr:hypothetical protein [Thermoanaerobaculia bacterium]
MREVTRSREPSPRLTLSAATLLPLPAGEGWGEGRLLPLPTGEDRGEGCIADAVIVNAASRDLAIAFGGSDGVSPSRTGTVPGTGRSWRVLIADFDGNGRADAVTASPEDHTVTVLLAR